MSEQPTDYGETVAGAETRARNVLAAGGYDLGVGIEGGVADVEAAPGLFLVMWAAAGGDRLECGSGPALRLPEQVAERVRSVEELGPVMDDALGESGVARGRGAADTLTGGRIDRTEALSAAVAGALGPFATDPY